MVHADKQEEKFSTDWGPAPLREDRNCYELSSGQRPVWFGPGVPLQNPKGMLYLRGTLTVTEGTLTPGARQEMTALSPLFGARG